MFLGININLSNEELFILCQACETQITIPLENVRAGFVFNKPYPKQKPEVIPQKKFQHNQNRLSQQRPEINHKPS